MRRRSSVHAAAARARGDVEVLQHGELLEDAGGLERPADAEPGDLVHLLAEQLDVAELADRPGGLDQAGDRVDQRGLAGAVGADEEPQVALEQRRGRRRRPP